VATIGLDPGPAASSLWANPAELQAVRGADALLSSLHDWIDDV
jgi:hypothetical protein